VLGGAKPFVRTSQIKRDGTVAVIELAPYENGALHDRSG